MSETVALNVAGLTTVTPNNIVRPKIGLRRVMHRAGPTEVREKQGPTVKVELAQGRARSGRRARAEWKRLRRINYDYLVLHQKERRAGWAIAWVWPRSRDVRRNQKEERRRSAQMARSE